VVSPIKSRQIFYYLYDKLNEITQSQSPQKPIVYLLFLQLKRCNRACILSQLCPYICLPKV